MQRLHTNYTCSFSASLRAGSFGGERGGEKNEPGTKACKSVMSVDNPHRPYVVGSN